MARHYRDWNITPMVWSIVKTWVANTRVLDADLNAQIRDNILATMPGNVTASGQICVSSGLNQIAARDVTYTLVSASVVINSGNPTYRTLTGGPSITINTGTSAIVLWGCTIDGTSATYASHTVEVQGALVLDSIADSWALRYGSFRPAAAPFRGMSGKLFKGLTKGPNTFVSYYRYDGAGTATFNDRYMIVIPL